MCTLTCAFEQIKTNIQNAFLFWSKLIFRILLIFELVWKYGINYGFLDYVTFIPKIILQGDFLMTNMVNHNIMEGRIFFLNHNYDTCISI
jgi:hypothetical protein